MKEEFRKGTGRALDVKGGWKSRVHWVSFFALVLEQHLDVYFNSLPSLPRWDAPLSGGRRREEHAVFMPISTCFLVEGRS